MARGLPHISFNSSRLIRALAEIAVTDVADSNQSFAERLGQWLDVSDAISLFSVLKRGNGDAPGKKTPAITSEHQEFARVRDGLRESISTDGVFKSGNPRIKLPFPAAHASAEKAADFSPYHRYYLAHQRDMNASIGPLRVKVRAAMSLHSPALKQLAEMDAVFESALAGRERSLLATIPLILARRFEHLYKAHQLVNGNSMIPDLPAQWMQSGAWLATFCREMQIVLMAELEVRLQPVAGLIEALGNEVSESQ